MPAANAPAAPTAQTILADFIDWVRANGGDLTDRTIGRIASQTGKLVAEGKPDKHIRQGLADWFRAGKNAAILDDFVNAAINAEARSRLAQNGHGPGGTPRPSTTDRAMAEAQAVKARLAARRQEQS